MNSTGADHLVSVIIPTYHRPDFLTATLQSVLGQELPAAMTMEVIVCLSDPGATADRTAAGSAGDPRVRVVDAPRPGPAAARNAGIAAARGEFLAFIDDDCQAQSGWLRSGLQLLENADLLQGRTEPQSFVGGYDHSLRIIPPSWLWETCNLMARRSMVDRAGGFDEGVNPTKRPHDHFGEDIEWGWRLVRAGARVAFAPDAVVLHAVMERDRAGFLRYQARLRYMPWLFRRVPEARRHFIAGHFYSPRHVALTASAGLLIAAGVTRLAGRRRAAAALAGLGTAGYLFPWRGALRPVAISAIEEAVQLGSVLYGSIRWRRILL